MGKADGKVLQWQQRDALEEAVEDVPSLSASLGGTWAGGEQPITSFRGHHTSPTVGTAQLHRPCPVPSPQRNTTAPKI